MHDKNRSLAKSQVCSSNSRTLFRHFTNPFRHFDNTFTKPFPSVPFRAHPPPKRQSHRGHHLKSSIPPEREIAKKQIAIAKNFLPTYKKETPDHRRSTHLPCSDGTSLQETTARQSLPKAASKIESDENLM